MKKLTLFVLFSIFFPLNGFAKLNVVATLPVFASLASEVGGDRIIATSLAKGNQDPHFLDAKPAYAVALNRAELLIEGGLELETGWLPPLLIQARNSKILPNTSGHVNLAQGINILEIPKKSVNRSMGDVHPSGNPHTWLDPRNAKVMAANIYQHLVQIDPDGKNDYSKNLESFISRMNEKNTQWKKQLESLKEKNVITYHKSLAYFADWAEINIVDTVEAKPGIPPSSSRVDALLKIIPSTQAKAIVIENFYPKKIPEYLAQKAGIPMILIPTDTGEEEIKTYFDLIDRIVNEMGKAK